MKSEKMRYIVAQVSQNAHETSTNRMLSILNRSLKLFLILTMLTTHTGEYLQYLQYSTYMRHL